MNRRKSLIATGLIVLIAIVGLVMVNTNEGAAVGQTKATLDNDSPTTSAEVAMSPLGDSALPAIGKMLGALAVVLVAIYAGVWLLRRSALGRRHGKGNRRLLEVLDTSYLGTKKTLSLVRVGEKSVLIGVSEAGMTMLTELDADQTAIALADDNTVESPEPDGFDKLMAKAVGQLRKRSGLPKTATMTE